MEVRYSNLTVYPPTVVTLLEAATITGPVFGVVVNSTNNDSGNYLMLHNELDDNQYTITQL